jgi:mRNA interferase MazF
LKRGEIWTVSGGADYTGKPRPAIILQNDEFDATPSVTVCPLSRTSLETVYARFTLAPSESTGLEVQSQVMVDKISTIPRSKVGRQIGKLDRADLIRLNRRVVIFLGLAE